MPETPNITLLTSLSGLLELEQLILPYFGKMLIIISLLKILGDLQPMPFKKLLKRNTMMQVLRLWFPLLVPLKNLLISTLKIHALSLLIGLKLIILMVLILITKIMLPWSKVKVKTGLLDVLLLSVKFYLLDNIYYLMLLKPLTSWVRANILLEVTSEFTKKLDT
jgi:hypothetical protein